MNRIVCAAIKCRISGTLFLGVRHFDHIMNVAVINFGHNILQEAYIPNCKKEEYEQGFIDSKGNFVDRKEACTIAKKANQIIKKHPPEDQLFSEDLY